MWSTYCISLNGKWGKKQDCQGKVLNIPKELKEKEDGYKKACENYQYAGGRGLCRQGGFSNKKKDPRIGWQWVEGKSKSGKLPGINR